MMATWADLGMAPKKKITTYGKGSNKKRNEPGVTAGSSVQSSGPGLFRSWTPPDLDREEDVAPRRVEQAEKTTKPPAPAERARADRPASSQTGVTADGSRGVANHGSRGGKEVGRAIKRKPSQVQSPNRQTKKQRSSSPDSSAVAQSSTKDTLPTRKTPAAPSNAATSSQRKTTPPRGTIVKDAPDTMPFSPGTAKALDTLSVGKRKAELPAREIPFRPPGGAPARFGSTSTKERVSLATARGNQQAPAKPRRRLIDMLAAQAQESSSEGEEDDDDVDGRDEVKDIIAQGRSWSSRASPVTEDIGDRPSQVAISPERASVAVAARQVTIKKPGVKFTYSQQRTVLAEDPMASLAASGDDLLMSQALMPNSQSNLSTFSFDEEMEDGPAAGAIRSIHELRQAGANNRVSDEVDDMLDRVGSPNPGKPSSTRRSALLELSKKLHEKAFLRQFRDHGGETSLFRDLGREKDAIAAYTLCCILITLLANPVSNHLLQQLRQQGIASLFALLLAHDDDIGLIAKERKSNVSNQGRASIMNMKSAIQKLPVWKPAAAAPSRLSPRTVALKGLELVIRQSRAVAGGSEIISPAVTEQLFNIVSSASESQDSEHWDFPNETEAMDLYLALSLLELHSVYAMQSDLGSEWIGRYLPVVADILDLSLRRRSDRLGDIECLALKVTLNTTNNNTDAQRVFVNKGLLRDLADTVCGTFEAVLKSTSSDEFASSTLDSLVLMLGVMINFSENDAAAGLTLAQQGDSEPLDKLIKFFLNYRSATAEADSVEKSQINVAFGYLSVLLGYLCLCEPIRERFASLHSGGNLEPLLGYVREFIAYHREAEKSLETVEGEPISFAGRLQGLVDELESLA